MKADKEQIKQSITMPDTLSLYGIRHDKNRIPCPIRDHKRRDPSFVIKSNSWKCFSCDDGGDIFSFVMRMENCSFETALNIICERFSIPNDDDSTPEQRRAFKQALQARQNATRERERLRDAGQYAYNRLCAYRRYLNALEPDNVERCHRLDYVDYLLDEYLSDMEGMGRDYPDIDLYIKRIRKKWVE